MPTSDERRGNPPVDILWILAHPDDETFGSAGTIAWATDRGLRTAYVCATRGEAGEIRDPELGTQAMLGAVREQELRNAMAIVGLHELRMLGFRDSGMENTPANDDPRALIQQPSDAIVAHFASHIRDLRPASVVTFGPEGIYGHPDHILTGDLARQAVERAADPDYLPKLHQPWRIAAIYWAAAPRELLQAMADAPSRPLGEISARSRQNLGTPEAEITHRLDISRWSTQKRDAIASHRSQTADRDETASPAQERDDAMPAVEYYVRQPLPWDPKMTAVDPLTRARDEIGITSTSSVTSAS